MFIDMFSFASQTYSELARPSVLRNRCMHQIHSQESRPLAPDICCETNRRRGKFRGMHKRWLLVIKFYGHSAQRTSRVLSLDKPRPSLRSDRLPYVDSSSTVGSYLRFLFPSGSGIPASDPSLYVKTGRFSVPAKPPFLWSLITWHVNRPLKLSLSLTCPSLPGLAVLDTFDLEV